MMIGREQRAPSAGLGEYRGLASSSDVDRPGATLTRPARDSELEFSCLGVQAKAKGALAIVAMVVLAAMLLAFRTFHNS
jgi:hypothetical protein